MIEFEVKVSQYRNMVNVMSRDHLLMCLSLEESQRLRVQLENAERLLAARLISPPAS